VKELRHTACPPWRITDELAAYKLAQLPFPGVFGVFYQNERRTKNALEKKMDRDEQGKSWQRLRRRNSAKNF
jgi:hypothetical protein